jgi:aryl-alcohol dehydrogenase-like predicted oxidoreductase
MRLALGTAQFGMRYGVSNVNGKVTQEDGKAIIKYAASAGIDTIDTAMAYGDSEHVLGTIGVEAFKVVTKLPEIPNHVTDVDAWVVGAVEESVARLGVESLYGLLLHRPGQLFESRGVEIMSALRYLKGGGVVKNLGVSVFSPSELDALYTLYDFDIVQCPFNLVDRRLLNSGWLAKLRGVGVEVHTRSSFLQGLLLMPRDSIPRKFHAWRLLWDKWHVWLHRHQITPVEACLSYTLSCLEIDRVIVGVDTQDQLTEIVHAASGVVIDSYPDIKCDSTELINPANWGALLKL